MCVRIFHRVHPHSLVGKQCKRGVCTVEVNNETMTASFTNLGVQCVRRKDIEQELKVRQEIRVDPFRSMHVMNYCVTHFDCSLMAIFYFLYFY